MRYLFVLLVFLVGCENTQEKVYIQSKEVGDLIAKSSELIRAEKDVEAIEAATKAINLDPKCVSAYYNRGLAKELLGDKYGALSDFNSAIEIYEKYESGWKWDYSRAHKYRGVVKHKMGDIAGACQDWSKAGELGEADAYEMIQRHCQ